MVVLYGSVVTPVAVVGGAPHSTSLAEKITNGHTCVYDIVWDTVQPLHDRYITVA